MFSRRLPHQMGRAAAGSASWLQRLGQVSGMVRAGLPQHPFGSPAPYRMFQSSPARLSRPRIKDAQVGDRIVLPQPDVSEEQLRGNERRNAIILVVGFSVGTYVFLSRYSVAPPKYFEELPILEEAGQLQERRIRSEDLQSLIAYSLELAREAREEDAGMAVEELVFVQSERAAHLLAELFPQDAASVDKDLAARLFKAAGTSGEAAVDSSPEQRAAAIRQAQQLQDAWLAQRYPSTIAPVVVPKPSEAAQEASS